MHKRLVAEIPKCTSPISHNALLLQKCARALIFVAKLCIVGYETGALWDGESVLLFGYVAFLCIKHHTDAS